MSKDPAFLFYYQDFLVGVDHMTDEQVGQYIKCLCHQANRGSIRELHMKNICRTNVNYNVVRDKFKENGDGELFNERLRIEVEKRQNFCESRRKSIQHRYIRSTHVIRMENENENEIVNENTNKQPLSNITINKKEKKSNMTNVLKNKHLDFVLLTEDEHRKLFERFGEEVANNYIFKLNSYIGSKGAKYKSHYHTILNWANKDGTIDKVKDSDVNQLRKKFNLKPE